MSLPELHRKIGHRKARLAVIGLGYVGLPVACQFAQAGFNVLGVEIRLERVQLVNAGISPFEENEPGLAELLAGVIANGKLRATANYAELYDRDVILIDVETPVDESHHPQYEALRSAVCGLGPVLKPGALVIIESTIAPGTMQQVVLPLLSESSAKQVNRDYFLGNCPERVMPGKLLTNLRTLSRVVGGMTPDTAAVMVALYRWVVQADLDPTDCITAELVKTVENAYRDVQIAFANEVALICEAVGGDVWKVRELVNKTPYRQMHLPGAGVGGHCIPKDPWLLAYGVKDRSVPVRLIPAARAVNDSMPGHMAGLVSQALADAAGCPLAGARILVLGYAYLEDSDDTRNSPSERLVSLLQGEGAETVVHDPYVPGYQGDLYEMARDCSAVVVMVSHREYLHLDLEQLKSALRTPLLVEGRPVMAPGQAQEAGFLHYRVGQAPLENVRDGRSESGLSRMKDGQEGLA